MMRIHCFQHVPFETPARIGEWAMANGHEVVVTPLWQDVALPALSDYDWLVVLGGPMNTCDDSQYPWLKREKRAIETAISARKTVVGVCLGAQLVAAVLGARVYRGEAMEIGWLPVRRTGADHPVVADCPDVFDVFQWHGDTFDLPGGAVHLAQSDAYENQMFIYDDRVLGIQFHLEMSLDGVEALVDHCGADLTGASGPQTRAEILAENPRLHRAHHVLDSILDRL